MHKFELHSTLSSLTECPICCETYTFTNRKPKLMSPCGHTICLQCGLTYCRHKVVSSPGDRIACPVCRRGVRLPVGGLPALPNNLTMMRLIDARDVMERCESEAEFRSALDMVDGLLACEMRLQGTADELQLIKGEILAVLHRRQHPKPPATSSSSKTKVTSSPPAAAATGPSITSGTFNERRRNLTIRASVNKSVSAGNVNSPPWSPPSGSSRRLSDNNQTAGAASVDSDPMSQLLWVDITGRSESFSPISSTNQLPVASSETLAIQPTGSAATNWPSPGSVEGWQHTAARVFINSCSLQAGPSFKSAIFGFVITIIIGLSFSLVVRMMDPSTRDDDQYQFDDI